MESWKEDVGNRGTRGKDGAVISERAVCMYVHALMRTCLVCFHLLSLPEPLIHSDLSIVGKQMSWVRCSAESTGAVSLFSTLFPWLSPFILFPGLC